MSLEPLRQSSQQARRWAPATFAVTISLNAFLLFLLEPLFGKMALPHLGGTAAVWTTCLLFFQVALVCGYLYSHAVATFFPLRVQVAVHIALTAAAILTLPVGIPAGWTPGVSTQPEFSLIALLSMRIGAPFVLLAAGSPLLQHWFSRAPDATGRDPYALYVASNVGSFAALVAYPFLIEPWLKLSDQSRYWAVAYVILIVSTLSCGVIAARGGALTTPVRGAADRVSWKERVWWMALAAAPSSLLLGVTTHFTTNLAPIPLLWVIPLGLYLLTFVVAFGPERPRVAYSVHKALPYLVIAVAMLLFLQSEVPGPAGYAVHAVTFFCCALACHLRLAASRPPSSQLTEFYIWLSIGGALGGFFNVVIAPHAFRTVLEYPLALVAAAALSRAATPGWRWADIVVPAGLAFVLTGCVEALMHTVGSSHALISAMILGAGAIATFASRARPLRFALSAGAILVAGSVLKSGDGPTRFAGRSFYGVYRVVDDKKAGTRQFYSGTTIHGSEFFGDSGRTPLTYYHRDGPVGSLFAARAWLESPWRVGVIGLGTGATAAYARPGETWTFYEIDPLVARVAEDRTLFSFLSSARVRPRIVLGDARLSIEREPVRSFDVLMIDAFSSDAIPMHLLTREAVALYRSRLADDGVIAWHISNNYLDLRPVLEALATDAGLTALISDDSHIPEPSGGRFASIWVVMTRADRTASVIEADPRWVRLRSGRRLQLWTDDFSNLLSVVR